MQAIEFEADLTGGIIHLPRSYQHWQEGRHVKVIVLAAERDTPEGGNINCHAGKITLTQDPLEFQGALRDEWS